MPLRKCLSVAQRHPHPSVNNVFDPLGVCVGGGGSDLSLIISVKQLQGNRILADQLFIKLSEVTQIIRH